MTDGAALLGGREFPVLYAGLDSLLDVEAIRKLVFLARKGETAARLAERFRELCPALDAERADYHILWALKHDLLEPAQPDGQTGGQTGCQPEGQRGAQ